ncbi:Hypothetical predicted protein, partial [Olea europaea subsp. europaea]
MVFQEIRSIKDRAKEFIVSKIVLIDEHYVAAYLCRNIRGLSQLIALEKDRTFKAVQKLLNALP